jgi:hypothetical protein
MKKTTNRVARLAGLLTVILDLGHPNMKQRNHSFANSDWSSVELKTNKHEFYIKRKVFLGFIHRLDVFSLCAIVHLCVFYIGILAPLHVVVCE